MPSSSPCSLVRGDSRVQRRLELLWEALIVHLTELIQIVLAAYGAAARKIGGVSVPREEHAQR